MSSSELIQITSEQEIESKKTLLFLISGIMFLFTFPTIIIFWKFRRHHIIHFRPVMLSMIGSISMMCYCVLSPLFLGIGADCILNAVISNTFPLAGLMANLSRYMKIYLTNKRDIFRVKMYNQRYADIFTLRSTNSSGSGIENDKFYELEPNSYIKRLNKFVAKKITLYLFILPVVIMLIVGAVNIYLMDSYEGSCKSAQLYYPIIALTVISLIVMIVISVNIFKYEDWSKKLDISMSIIGIILGSLLYFLAGELKFGGLQSKSLFALFFLIPNIAAFTSIIIIPLIQLYIYKRKSRKATLLNKNEFTRLLVNNNNYIESLKGIAIHYYCVETVLLWESHFHLMKKIGAVNNTEKMSIKSEDFKNNYGSITNGKNSSDKKMEMLNSLNQNIYGSKLMQMYDNPQSPGIENKTLGNNEQSEISNRDREYYERGMAAYGNDNYNRNMNRKVYNENSPRSPIESDYYQKYERRAMSFSECSDKGKRNDGKYYITDNNEYTTVYNNSIPTTAPIDYGLRCESPQSPLEKAESNSIYGSYGDITKNNILLKQMKKTKERNYSLSSQHSNSSFSPQNNILNEVYLNDKAGLLIKNSNNATSPSTISYINDEHQKQQQQLYQQQQQSIMERNHVDSQTSSTSNMYSHAYTNTPTEYSNHQTSTIHTLNSNVTIAMDGSSNDLSIFNKKGKAKTKDYELLYELFNIKFKNIPLDPKFRKDYENLYYLYICEDGLATVNINPAYVSDLRGRINSGDFTVDMFIPAISETIDLIYQNLYPKLVIMGK